MSLFRSKEHVDRWVQSTGNAPGDTVPLATVWRLANAWYVDPRSPTWRARTRDESQDVIASAGLRGEFWELPWSQ